MSLKTHVKVDQILGYFAAGTTVRKSSVIDMAGYEGCMFIFEFGTLLETGTLAAVINGNDTNATGGDALSGSVTYTVTAADALLTQSAIVIDVYQPEPSLHRYLEAQITPAVANAVLLGVTAIRYGGKLKPEVTTGLLASSIVASPAVAA